MADCQEFIGIRVEEAQSISKQFPSIHCFVRVKGNKKMGEWNWNYRIGQTIGSLHFNFAKPSQMGM
jgi:hypothetical protein